MINHERLEKNTGILLLLTLVIIAIGGLIEIVPLFYINETIETVQKEITVTTKDADGKEESKLVTVDAIRPYTPLEQMGRDIYVREGCYNCHSQMIRPLQDEQQRYGHYSLAAESKFDHPFQWGSKRTGPDLARLGGKYANEWHVRHLIAPRDLEPRSIMPAYPWLMKNELNYQDIGNRLRALRFTGVPYSLTDQEYAENVERFGESVANMLEINQAAQILERQAAENNYDGDPNRLTEMDAIVAYLQILGTFVDFSSFNEGHFSKFRSRTQE